MDQVQVRFTTRSKHTVTDAPILVPAKLRRYGLSEIVNHLLGSAKPIPFDFLVEGEFLRQSLAQYLEANGLSSEHVITLEYVESMLPPTPLASFQHDDWISSVKAVSRHNVFLTGAYDGHVRLWNKSGECVSTMKGHKAAVKSIAVRTVEDGKAIFYSGSMDQSMLCWEYSFPKGASHVLYECKGHKGAVESVTVDKEGQMIASASADGTIKLWSSTLAETQDEPHVDGKKKRRTSLTHPYPIQHPTSTFDLHVGSVSGVIFDPQDTNRLFSGGWDHSVRSWDVEQGVNLLTKNCEKVTLALDYSPHVQLLASGHADKSIRLWDMRADDDVMVRLSLTSHTNWVPTVAWSPTSSFHLASGSYDGTTKLWDIRSPKAALYTLDHPRKQQKGKSTESNKIFSVCWDNDLLLSGGEAGELWIHQTKL